MKRHLDWIHCEMAYIQSSGTSPTTPTGILEGSLGADVHSGHFKDTNGSSWSRFRQYDELEETCERILLIAPL